MYNNKTIKLIITILVIFVTVLNFSIMVYGVGVEDNPNKYKPSKPNDDNLGRNRITNKSKYDIRSCKCCWSFCISSDVNYYWNKIYDWKYRGKSRV
ncbi:MAG: hypothetical protein V8R51_02270 [Clostridia bacterium]